MWCVDEVFQRSTTAISNAPPMATASSIKAAGRSLPKAVASFARKARPPRVPMIAPIIPAHVGANTVTCPKTGKLTSQKDNDKVFLVAIG